MNEQRFNLTVLIDDCESYLALSDRELADYELDREELAYRLETLKAQLAELGYALHSDDTTSNE